MYGSPEQIKQLTGLTTDRLSDDMSDIELDAILNEWITHIGVEINTRLGEVIPIDDSRYKGIEAVALRTIAKLVTYALQNRTSGIVQVNEFTIKMLDASEVVKSLDRELKPYVKRTINLFHSGEEWENASN
ncbi:hypothetical protein IC620_15510 [Hazenella sp. IB182357]|uniref:Uncharacterized protein n=1 Tax=Polycladospora coralii TaxID=2771432 RepID=A0A926RV37_9BACL|nr:hypothetical protein [Polycladospora coralii]MBD1373753.1 hypothetical protein [Polycladospora coralii]